MNILIYVKGYGDEAQISETQINVLLFTHIQQP